MTEEPRVIDLSIEVSGTPEQVWEAIATGPGITSWFVPHELEQREGGAVRMDFGTEYGAEDAVVEAWDPPRRVVLRSQREGGMAYEWTVQAADGGHGGQGGQCVVRLVNSGFGAGEEWDADYDGMSSGWRIFLENLRLHCAHFIGQHARAVIPTRSAAGTKDEVFARLCAALGIAADLAEGDAVRTGGDGVPALCGTVARVLRTDATTTYLLVLDDPAPGHAFLSAEGMGGQTAVSTYLYLYGPAAATLPDTWSPFLAARFPAEEAAPAER